MQTSFLAFRLSDPSADWAVRFAVMARRIPRLGRTARPTLLGFSAFVDACVSLDGGLALFADTAPAPARRLAAELVGRIAQAKGGEIDLGWPEGDLWLSVQLLPADVGLVSSIEGEGFDVEDGERITRFRTGWTVRKIKLLGADMVKLLWYYRPEAKSAERQRQLVRDLVAQCADWSVPLVVEPIWYALPGEDQKSAAWQARRVEGILESALFSADCGADMLKVEFPGDVSTAEGRAASAVACKRLTDSMAQPWVILSAGVGFEDFRTQVEISCRAGAAGFLAGRSIWQEAVATRDPVARAAAAEAAAGRLAELTAIARALGRPYVPAITGDQLTADFPDGWYTRWQEA